MNKNQIDALVVGGGAATGGIGGAWATARIGAAYAQRIGPWGIILGAVIGAVAGTALLKAIRDEPA